MQYSTVAGALVGSLFTEDPAVLTLSASMSVVHPQRLELSLARYAAEGLSTTATYDDVGSFLSAIEVVIGGLSMDTIHADHLVVAADMYMYHVQSRL